MSNILITGAASGLGLALAEQLISAGHAVLRFDREYGDDVRYPNIADLQHMMDLREGKLDVLINCAGVNLINWLQDVSEEEWDRVMDVNAKGIFMMSQACLPYLLNSRGTILNIVSNAAHMPMRSSLAYNASKGAALIMTKQLARELTSQGVTVFSVSPNKLAGTGMSKAIDDQVVRVRGWTHEQAQKYQLAGLLTGEDTPPAAVAEFIAFLLQDKNHHKYLSGCDIPYGA